MRNERTIPRQTRGVPPDRARLYAQLADARHNRDDAWRHIAGPGNEGSDIEWERLRYRTALAEIDVLTAHIQASEAGL